MRVSSFLFFALVLPLALLESRAQGWIQNGGPIVIFALLFACGLGLPLPEDIPLTIGGFFVAKGQMNLAAVSVFAWCGIIGGDCVLYHLGKKFGLNITRVPFIGRHLTRERILKAERLFDKYGIWVVAVGRLIAGIRGGMVVAAGTIRFNFLKFLIADGLAALVSGGAFVALGYFLGKKLDNIEEIRQKAKPVEHWIFLGIGVAVLLFVLYLFWRRRRRKTLSDVALEKVEQVLDHVPAVRHDLQRPTAGDALVK